MKKPRVLLDVDGVLADFLQKALPVVEKLQKAPFTRGHVTRWEFFDDLPPAVVAKAFDEYTREGWCGSLMPLPGAQQGVRALRKVADVYVVTSPMHGPHWAYERTVWLLDNFNIPRHRVVHTAAKHLVSGDFLVDDRPSTCRKWKKHHPRGEAILWDDRSSCWTTLVDHVQGCM